MSYRAQDRLERERSNEEQIAKDLSTGDLPKNFFDGVSTKRRFQTYGLFRVTSALIPEIQPDVRMNIAQNKDPNIAARRISRISVKVQVADVEIVAEDLGDFDDIWPMTRFQNVDLRLAA